MQLGGYLLRVRTQEAIEVINGIEDAVSSDGLSGDEGGQDDQDKASPMESISQLFLLNRVLWRKSPT